VGVGVQAAQADLPVKAQTPGDAVPLLRTAIAQMDSEDGWVSLGALGTRLANLAADFDPRSYGVAKLSDLVRKSGAFDIEQTEGRRVRVRLRPEAATATPKPRRRSRRPRSEKTA
jgi:hypothetical protein